MPVCDIKCTRHTNRSTHRQPAHTTRDKHNWRVNAGDDATLVSEHQHADPQRERGEVALPTQLKGLWPPCQHNLSSTLGPPSLAASPFASLSSPLPPTRVYFCQLPYSCLHSVFAPTHKTFLVRADEALPPTAGTPGKMVNRHTSFC